MTASGSGQPRRYSKPVVVPARLELLAGPTAGVVRLPRHLDWSLDPTYNLDHPGRIIDLYRTVINEATNPDDLYHFLNEMTLKRLWSYMWLPGPTRRAWEDRFPELRQISQLAA